MKKIFFIITLALISISGFCQGYTDKLNLQVGGGITFSQNESIDGVAEHTIAFNKDSQAFDAYIAMSQEMTKCWGWRLYVGQSKNKGRANKDTEAIADIYSFYDAEVFGDVTFDLIDLFIPNRTSNVFNMKLFGGIGALYTFGFSNTLNPIDTTPRLYFGFRGGMDFVFNITEHFGIIPELSITGIASDKFNGIVDDFPIDARIAGNVGIIWYF